MRLKLQSAMEYLMTYGWLMLIVAIVIIALLQLGLFNSSNLASRAIAGACEVVHNAAGSNLAGQCTNEIPQYTAQFNGQSSSISTGYYQTSITSYTITAWVMTTSAGANPIFQDRGSGAGMSFTLEIGYNGGQSSHPGTINCGVDSNGIWIGGYTSAAVNDGRWHFIACTLSEANGNPITPSAIAAYADGVIVPMSTAQIGSATSPISGLGPAIIGYHQAWNNYFNGQISNVQIYNTSLSSNEINLLYREGIGGAPIDPTHIVGWWPLNGNANDYSGDYNNGIPSSISYNGSWTSAYVLP